MQRFKEKMTDLKKKKKNCLSSVKKLRGGRISFCSTMTSRVIKMWRAWVSWRWGENYYTKLYLLIKQCPLRHPSLNGSNKSTDSLEGKYSTL